MADNEKSRKGPACAILALLVLVAIVFLAYFSYQAGYLNAVLPDKWKKAEMARVTPSTPAPSPFAGGSRAEKMRGITGGFDVGTHDVTASYLLGMPGVYGGHAPYDHDPARELTYLDAGISAAC